jgi:hypothetical protein
VQRRGKWCFPEGEVEGAELQYATAGKVGPSHQIMSRVEGVNRAMLRVFSQSL